MPWNRIGRINQLQPKTLVLLAGGLYVLYQMILYWAGIQFDVNCLTWFLHFADVELLKTRLLETCYYFHIQPPLFNFLVGIGLKLGGASYVGLFLGCYLLLGYFLYLTMLFLMIRLGISQTISLTLSTLFMISPSFVLYQYWIFYSFPCTLILIVTAWLLPDVLTGVPGGKTFLFFICLMLLCGLWSLFHLLWFIVITAGVCLAARKQYRKILVMAFLPFLCVVALYAKNFLLFGNFGPSTIMGRNLWINTVGNMRWTDRERLINTGVLSEVSRFARWNDIEVYPPEYARISGFEGIPVLRNTMKSDGVHNFNHLAQLNISNAYLRDAKAGLRADPLSFVRSMAISTYGYFRPPATYFENCWNWNILASLNRAYDYVCFGKLPVDLRNVLPMARVTGSPPYLFLIVGLPLLFGYGLFCVWRGRSGTLVFDAAQRWLLAYMLFNILYVAAVGIVFDFAETQRYRFSTDPFSLALLGIVIQRLVGNKNVAEINHVAK